jgi:hypothetical protein
MKNYKEERTWQSIFHRYFNEILSEKTIIRKDPGPYVSISRDFGCMANSLAGKLAEELNKTDCNNLSA